MRLTPRSSGRIGRPGFLCFSSLYSASAAAELEPSGAATSILPMKPQTKRLFLVLGCLLLLGVTGTAWLAYSFLSPDSAAQPRCRHGLYAGVGVALLRFRYPRSSLLSPPPAACSRAASGCLFSRRPADIEHWLQQSPGTREVVPTPSSPSGRHFEIAPGGGAAQAEVTVDDARHRVSIHVCWS